MNNIYAFTTHIHIAAAGTNGGGPQGVWDYGVVILACAAVAIAIALAIKYLVAPGEKSPDHIKRKILDL